MPKSFVLGVDGGNTKTDFALLDLKGNLLEWVHSGSCSHEQLAGGFQAAAQALDECIGQMCARQGIKKSEIAAAAMGLAGIDTRHQQRGMMDATQSLGIENRVMVNDAFPPIKAVSPDGCGICSSHGTGVVTGGIDKTGKMLQVGGIGQTVGDRAGGAYLAAEAVQAVYASLLRNGAETSMSKPILELFEVEDPERFMDAISLKFDRRSSLVVSVLGVLFSECDQGDPAAQAVVHEVAQGLADSVIGCYRRLSFEDPVCVILAGTVWEKASPSMRQWFEERIRRHITQPLEFIPMPGIPPVTGAACWAMQLAQGTPLDTALRERICTQFAAAKLLGRAHG